MSDEWMHGNNSWLRELPAYEDDSAFVGLPARQPLLRVFTNSGSVRYSSEVVTLRGEQATVDWSGGRWVYDLEGPGPLRELPCVHKLPPPVQLAAKIPRLSPFSGSFLG